MNGRCRVGHCPNSYGLKKGCSKLIERSRVGRCPTLCGVQKVGSGYLKLVEGPGLGRCPILCFLLAMEVLCFLECALLPL